MVDALYPSDSRGKRIKMHDIVQNSTGNYGEIVTICGIYVTVRDAAGRDSRPIQGSQLTIVED